MGRGETAAGAIVERLWVDLNGAVCCDEDAGIMLGSAIEAWPERKKHATTITVWTSVGLAGSTALEVVDEEDLEWARCEDCQAGLA